MSQVWSNVSEHFFFLFLNNALTKCSPTDAASFSPADPLPACRGRQFTNKLLQRQRGCGRLVIRCRGELLLDRLECLSLSSPVSPLPAPRFYMYKLPHKHDKKFSGEGEKYLLLEKGSEEWTNGKGSVNDSAGALGQTVGQLYSHSEVRCRDSVSDPSHHYISHFHDNSYSGL